MIFCIPYLQLAFVCIYQSVHTHTHARMHVCTHTCMHAHAHTHTLHVFPTDPVLFICTCTNLPFTNTACFDVARCLHFFPIAWYVSACAPLKNILQSANLSLLVSPPRLHPWERTTPATGHLSLSVVV